MAGAITATPPLGSAHGDSKAAAGGHAWPYAVGGALFLFVLVVIANGGDYEGGDAVLILGPLAALVGALVCTLVGGLIRGRRRER